MYVTAQQGNITKVQQTQINILDLSNIIFTRTFKERSIITVLQECMYDLDKSALYTEINNRITREQISGLIGMMERSVLKIFEKIELQAARIEMLRQYQQSFMIKILRQSNIVILANYQLYQEAGQEEEKKQRVEDIVDAALWEKFESYRFNVTERQEEIMLIPHLIDFVNFWGDFLITLFIIFDGRGIGLADQIFAYERLSNLVKFSRVTVSQQNLNKLAAID